MDWSHMSVCPTGRFSVPFALAVLACLAVGTRSEAQFTQQQAQAHLSVVERVLSASPDTAAVWSDYLQLDTLGAELAKGGEADRETIASIGARLGGRGVSVDPEVLTPARDALAVWLENPGDGQAVTSARRSLRTLQNWIRRNRSRAGGWNDFLEINEWNVELRKGEEADMEWARSHFSRYGAALAPPAAEPFENLQNSLKHWYAELGEQLSDPLALDVRKAKADFQPLSAAKYQQELNRLRVALAEMDGYLRSGGPQKEQGWKEYLGWRTLHEELQRTDRPRLEVVDRALERFGGEAAGLDRRPFIKVQRRLRSFVSTLRAAESGESRLNDQRDTVRRRVEQLEQFLARGGETKESGWKRYLRWDQWYDEVYADTPDPRALAGAASRLRRDATGLEKRAFRNLEVAIDKYLELYVLNERYSTQNDYLDRLESLARALDRRMSADPSEQAEVLSQLEWLRVTGQADWLVSRIEQRRQRPNFRVQAAESLVIQQVNDVANQRSPVGRCFEGAWVNGTADTHAVITGNLIPSANRIALDIVLHGTTFTNSVATQRRVQVYSHGNTLTEGRKRLYLDEAGLQAEPAVAASSSRQQINAIQVNRRMGRRLITRVATRRAYEKKPRAERLANTDTSQAIRENMDQQASEMVAKVNQSLELRVEKPLRANNLYPDQLLFSSTDDHVQFQGLLAPGDSLGPDGPAPSLPVGDDMATNIHQTAANNVLAEYLGDVTLNSDQMDALMERFNIVPTESPASAGDEAGAGDGTSEEDEPWSITFDHLQPVTVQFTDQKVTIAIVGRRFTRGGDTITDRIRMRASYRIAWNDTRVELTRDGDVEVDFLDVTGQLSSERLAYKSFLRKKIEPVFRESITTDDLPQNEATARLQAFRLKSLQLHAGWLTAGLDVDTSQLEGLGLK